MPTYLAPPTLPPGRPGGGRTRGSGHQLLGRVAAGAGLLLAVLIVLGLVPRGLPPTSLDDFTGSRAFVEVGEDPSRPVGREP